MAKIEVTSELCKGCQLCIKACPKGILGLGENFNSKGYKYINDAEEGCVGCKFCAITCPEAAISVFK